MKYLCIGRSAYDITLLLDCFPEENKKIKLNYDVIKDLGGCAANVASLLAKWKEEVYIVSTIGKDYHGELIQIALKKSNINTKYLQIENNKTTVSYILVNKKNLTRTILTNSSKKNISSINIKEKFDYLLTDGTNFLTTYNYIQNNPNCISILDAGEQSINIIKLCKIVNYIICSSDFAKEYSEIEFNDDIELIKKAYDKIQKDFQGLLIITLEKKGSFVKIDNNYYLVPSIDVKGIDTTGAGDIYHGAFLYFISKGYNILEAMKYSNIAAGISVTKIGVRNSIPSFDEVINYVK